jgi:hypothetical protein
MSPPKVPKPLEGQDTQLHRDISLCSRAQSGFKTLMNMAVHIQVLMSRIASQNCGHFHLDVHSTTLISHNHSRFREANALAHLGASVVLPNPLQGNQAVVTVSQEFGGRR